jgi:hypothetical protein
LIVVSEQADQKPFNRGWCCNGGFLAVEPYCDYVCFHDVDHLPESADYSFTSEPTQIMWHHNGRRPIRVSPDNQLFVVSSGEPRFIGTVFVIDKMQFRDANGFSNEYESLTEKGVE